MEIKCEKCGVVLGRILNMDDIAAVPVVCNACSDNPSTEQEREVWSGLQTPASRNKARDNKEKDKEKNKERKEKKDKIKDKIKDEEKAKKDKEKKDKEKDVEPNG